MTPKKLTPEELEEIRTGLFSDYNYPFFGGSEKLFTHITALEQENAKLREAIYWALGEGDDFPFRKEGQGSYWWRRELRARSELPVQAALAGKEKGI